MQNRRDSSSEIGCGVFICLYTQCVLTVCCMQIGLTLSRNLGVWWFRRGVVRSELLGRADRKVIERGG